MIAEKDVAQYLDKPVRIKLADGGTFDGIYWDWQLGVSFDVPDAMIFDPIKDMGLNGGRIEIAAARIVSVEPLS